MAPGPELGAGCYPVTWLLLALALPWPPGRDVGSGCYPDLAQGSGGGAGFGAWAGVVLLHASRKPVGR